MAMLGNCICVNDYDPPELYVSKLVKARKNWVCYECGDPIKRGSKYEVATGLYEGDFRRYRTCFTCVCVRRSLFKCGFVHGRLWEDLADVYGGFDEDEGEEDWLR